jgi:hypothetical protein
MIHFLKLAGTDIETFIGSGERQFHRRAAKSVPRPSNQATKQPGG